jgi:VanZ family protein
VSEGRPSALWLLSAGILIPVVLLSLGPDPDVTSGLWQTVGHAVGYALLTVSLLLAAARRPGQGRYPVRNRAALIVGATVGLGVLIEVSQLLTGRDADPLDVAANSTGVLVAFGAWLLLRRRQVG